MAKSDTSKQDVEQGPEPHANVYAALAAINREIDAIGKSQKNQSQGWNFRGIDDAYNTLHELLAKHGVVTIPRVVGRERTERVNKSGTVLAFTILDVEYDFVHESGSVYKAGPVTGEGMDSGDKGSNKALAVAHKYVLFQTFTIPTLFTDPDAEVHEVTNRMDDTTRSKIEELGEYMTDDQRAFYEKNADTLTQNLAERLLHRLQEAYAKSAEPGEVES